MFPECTYAIRSRSLIRYIDPFLFSWLFFLIHRASYVGGLHRQETESPTWKGFLWSGSLKSRSKAVHTWMHVAVRTFKAAQARSFVLKSLVLFRHRRWDPSWTSESIAGSFCGWRRDPLISRSTFTARVTWVNLVTWWRQCTRLKEHWIEHLRDVSLTFLSVEWSRPQERGLSRWALRTASNDERQTMVWYADGFSRTDIQVYGTSFLLKASKDRKFTILEVVPLHGHGSAAVTSWRCKVILLLLTEELLQD